MQAFLFSSNTPLFEKPLLKQSAGGHNRFKAQNAAFLPCFFLCPKTGTAAPLCSYTGGKAGRFFEEKCFGGVFLLLTGAVVALNCVFLLLYLTTPSSFPRPLSPRGGSPVPDACPAGRRRCPRQAHRAQSALVAHIVEKVLYLRGAGRPHLHRDHRAHQGGGTPSTPAGASVLRPTPPDASKMKSSCISVPSGGKCGRPPCPSH